MHANVAVLVLASLLILVWLLDVTVATSTSFSLARLSNPTDYIDSYTQSGLRVRDYVGGVTRVDVELSQRRGYKRRILPYERVDEILIPEISDDSRICDDFDEIDPVQRNLVKCSIDEGELACFNCIESRRYKRICVHLDSDVTIYRDSTPIILPKNSTPTEGYCLPPNFSDMAPPSNNAVRSCNAYTGAWILSRLQTSDVNSYNWVCSCRYPQLMTNLTSPLTDCLRDVACGPYGHLDPASAAGQQDPYVKGSCVCSSAYVPSFVEGVGPVCATTNLRESSDAAADFINGVIGETYGFISSSDERIDKRFSQYFLNKPVLVPNPCLVDSITGEQLPESPYILQMLDIPRSDKWHDSTYVPPVEGTVRAALCIPDPQRLVSDPTIMSTLSQYIGTRAPADYLANNGGRWCNGVTRISNTDYPVANIDRAKYALFTYQFDAHDDSDLPDAGVLLSRKVFKHLDAVAAVQRDTAPSVLTRAYQGLRKRDVDATVQPFDQKDRNPKSYDSTSYCSIYEPHIVGNPISRMCFVCGMNAESYRLFWLDYNGLYYGVHNQNYHSFTRTWITDLRRYIALVNGGYNVESWQVGGVYEKFYVDTDDSPSLNSRVPNDRYIATIRCLGSALTALPYEAPGCVPNVLPIPGADIDEDVYRKSVKYISAVVTCGRMQTVNCNNWAYDGSCQVVSVYLGQQYGSQQYMFLNGFLYADGNEYPRDKLTCYQKDLQIPSVEEV